MLTNTLMGSEVQSGIIKTDISNHFAVCLGKKSLVRSDIKKHFHKKRY